MGQFTSSLSRRPAHNIRRSVPDEEDPEQQLAFSNTQGSFFGTHFLMCGGRFDLSKPEAYLFGENSDLDLLGARPITFPYASPLGSDEIKPLNALVNVRKESVKFVRVKNVDGSFHKSFYTLNFVLDADCPCYVQIHFNAREVYQDREVQFAYRHKREMCSDAYHFDMGSDQQFKHFTFDSNQWDVSELSYIGGLFFPVVIAVHTDGVACAQMQSTMCTIDLANDSSRSMILKPLRQKIACDGVVYLLQEIFGIENKEGFTSASDGDDSGHECVICMSEVRDTVILPCRHLCICSTCADTLRYKINTCPICRSPFRALIRLRAHRQTRNQIYETISLVEGLNGAQGCPTNGDDLNANLSDSRRRHSSRNRTALHEVMTMEQLTSDEKRPNDEGLDSECIEMTIIPSDNTQPFLLEDQGEQSSRSEVKTFAVVSRSGSVDSKTDDETEEKSRRRSLQPGSRNSSSQLLNRSNTVV